MATGRDPAVLDEALRQACATGPILAAIDDLLLRKKRAEEGARKRNARAQEGKVMSKADLAKWKDEYDLQNRDKLKARKAEMVARYQKEVNDSNEALAKRKAEHQKREEETAQREKRVQDAFSAAIVDTAVSPAPAIMRKGSAKKKGIIDDDDEEDTDDSADAAFVSSAKARSAARSAERV